MVSPLRLKARPAWRVAWTLARKSAKSGRPNRWPGQSTNAQLVNALADAGAIIAARREVVVYQGQATDRLLMRALLRSIDTHYTLRSTVCLHIHGPKHPLA